MDLDLLTRLNDLRRARKAAIVVTDIESGAQRLVERDGQGDDPLAAILAERFASGTSGMVAGSDGRAVFLTVSVPPPRMVVIGAVHISQALAPIARIAGFDVVVIDPRTAFATEDRFEGTQLLAEWPQDVIDERIRLDPFTAVVAVTHDPKIDDPAIIASLEAECFYVGALGSRKTHAKRVERLKETGLTEDRIARIAAPIGLPIGAQSPAEIAVAIMAQVIEALRVAPARAVAREAAA